MRVEGPLTLGRPVEEFRGRWSDALATGTQHVVVELSAVPAIDSSGIGALVRCHAAVKANGGKMVIAGAGELVKGALHLTQLDTVLSLHDDEASAMAALGPAV